MFDMTAAYNICKSTLYDVMEVDNAAKDGIMANLGAWDKNKAPLIELLRKHPNWKEEACAVVIDASIPKPIDQDIASKYFNLCMTYASATLEKYAWISPAFFMKNKITEDDELCIKQAVMRTGYDYMIQAFDHVKAGMKTSRFVRGAFAKLGINVDSKEFLEVFAPYADCISAVKNEMQHVIISANPADFLTMSYGTNWASCHILNPSVACTFEGDSYSGCYKAGCLSYMNDGASIIVYALEELPEDLSALPMQRKLVRNMFHVNLKTSAIMQSRFYPYGKNDYRFDAFRSLVQSVFAICMGVPNHWKLSHGRNDEDFRTSSYSLHYPDYHYSDNGINTSVPSCVDETINASNMAFIGNQAYCLSCGEDIVDEAECIFCDRCDDSRGVRCACCGERVDEIELYYCEDTGDYRCAECSWYCEDCDRNFSNNSDYEYLNGVRICMGCLECGDYVQCDDCGEWMHVDDAYYTEDGEHCFCEYHYNRLPKCDICGNTYISDDLNDTEDGKVCDDCLSGFAPCKHCGALRFEDNMVMADDGEMVCLSCLSSYNDEIAEQEEEEESA